MVREKFLSQRDYVTMLSSLYSTPSGHVVASAIISDIFPYMEKNVHYLNHHHAMYKVFNSAPLCSCNSISIGCLYHNQVAKYLHVNLVLKVHNNVPLLVLISPLFDVNCHNKY